MPMLSERLTETEKPLLPRWAVILLAVLFAVGFLGSYLSFALVVRHQLGLP